MGTTQKQQQHFNSTFPAHQLRVGMERRDSLSPLEAASVEPSVPLLAAFLKQ